MQDDPPNTTVHPGLWERRFVRSASDLAGKAFDVVVVGAGSAGCAWGAVL